MTVDYSEFAVKITPPLISNQGQLCYDVFTLLLAENFEYVGTLSKCTNVIENRSKLDQLFVYNKCTGCSKMNI